MDDDPPYECEYIAKLEQLLKDKMTRENPNTMHRDAHPKQHGLVKARFQVVDHLADEFSIGVLQPGAIYDCWVRFSNQNAPPLDDNKKDIRGVGLKLMNVPGDKLTTEDGNTTSQDFVLISTPVFVTHNVKEFFRLIQALVKGKFWLLLHFVFNPRSLLNLIRSNKCFASPLSTRYWSTTPYKLGEEYVVKYSLIPPIVEPKGNAEKLPDNYLRQAMVNQLSQSEHHFDFCIQLQTDAHTMPIEDPGKRWSEKISPFIKVADVTILQQEFDNPEQDRFGRDLSFNPWHGLPAHEPLGGINRARRVIYNALSKYRHTKNHVVRKEPTDFNMGNVL